MRVLQVLTCDGIGGTELMVVNLAGALDPERFAVHVALLAGPGPIVRRLQAAGVPATSLGGRGWLATSWRLMRLLRRARPDVVHAYGFKGPFLLRFLTRAAAPGARFVSGVQGLHPAEVEDVGGRKSRFVLALERLTSGLVDAYVANSRGALRLLADNDVDDARLRYIPNGIDADRWQPDPGRRDDAVPTVACVGRFISRKRQGDLAAAAATLLRAGARLRVVFAGDGPLLEDVRASVAALGIEEHIHFAGGLDTAGVHALLRSSDVYCQPSLWEGMPATVLEAMASGLPVVATRVNGIEDLVEEGRTGWLVPACAPGLLARALGEALADPARRSAFGAAGRRRIAAEFRQDRMVALNAELYEELAARRQRPGRPPTGRPRRPASPTAR